MSTSHSKFSSSTRNTPRGFETKQISTNELVKIRALMLKSEPQLTSVDLHPLARHYGFEEIEPLVRPITAVITTFIPEEFNSLPVISLRNNFVDYIYKNRMAEFLDEFHKQVLAVMADAFKLRTFYYQCPRRDAAIYESMKWKRIATRRDSIDMLKDL